MITKNFSFSEFACPCGKCSFVEGYQIDQKLVRDLQTIRNSLGQALRINSGCRCSDYNKSVGGADNSYHVACRAIDTPCTSSSLRHRIVKLAVSLNLTVGIAPTFIHLDNRENQSQP
jgi:uncharacterized protein YcbK (DUF882 family)